MKTKILRSTLPSIDLLLASGRLLACTMTSMLLLNTIARSASCGTITTYDVPGASTEPLLGTQPLAINPAGTITGFYYDAGDVLHGFVRAGNGTITTFDVPDAGTEPFDGTQALAISPAGTITGQYVEANLASHGFLRASDGTLSTFDAPGDNGIGPFAINPAEAVTGSYADTSDVVHGFLRTP
jgi:hypothetical protein